jgi:protein-disulfide isomerase-like protein with CxxC motif
MLGIDSFPSLAVEKSGQLHHIGLNYTDAQAMRAQIEAL